MTNDAPERALAALVVPRWGRLVETGDLYEPYRLVDADGVTVEAVSVYFQELLAVGRASSTVRLIRINLAPPGPCADESASDLLHAHAKA